MTLLDAVRSPFRRLHDSPRTEEAYLHWIRELILSHKGRHPRVLGRRDAFAVLDELEPPFRLLGEMRYGSGLQARIAIVRTRHETELGAGRGEVNPLGVVSPRGC